MRQAGDQVRITAQLIDTESGFHLWSETYDRKLDDIFAVQDEIAKAIVDQPADRTRASRPAGCAQRQQAPTQNVEAYELYLQGRAIWKRRGEDNLKHAIEFYQQAARHATRGSRAPTRRWRRPTSSCPATPRTRTTRRNSSSWRRPRRGRRWRSIRTSARRTPCSRRSTPTVATCSTPSRDSSSRSRWNRTSRRRTSGTRSCCRRSGDSTRRSRRRRSAQELDPTSPILAENLANAYLAKGDDDQALRYAKLAAELGLGGGSKQRRGCRWPSIAPSGTRRSG